MEYTLQKKIYLDTYRYLHIFLKGIQQQAPIVLAFTDIFGRLNLHFNEYKDKPTSETETIIRQLIKKLIDKRKQLGVSQLLKILLVLIYMCMEQYDINLIVEEIDSRSFDTFKEADLVQYLHYLALLDYRDVQKKLMTCYP